MRVRLVPRLVFATAVLGSGGCLPATVTTVPALSGRVIDRHGRPVPRATIEVSERPGSRDDAGVGIVPIRFAADADGRFARAEDALWVFHLIPGDVPGSDLQVQARSNDLASPPYGVLVRPGVRLFGLGKRQRVDVGDLLIWGLQEED